jgi:hypothetical protein
MCATVPQHWGRNSFPDKAKDHVQDQKRDYDSNDDYSFILAHPFTIGTRRETISHTPGKILSSVM